MAFATSVLSLRIPSRIPSRKPTFSACFVPLCTMPTSMLTVSFIQKHAQPIHGRGSCNDISALERQCQLPETTIHARLVETEERGE
jgi:hypothetical protein